MTEPYLILHKVRGEPAFDIAERLEVTEGDSALEPVWIIPTSGHRAYPWVYWKLSDVSTFWFQEPMPSDWPDHYACSNETPKPRPPTRAPVTTDDFLI